MCVLLLLILLLLLLPIELVASVLLLLTFGTYSAGPVLGGLGDLVGR